MRRTEKQDLADYFEYILHCRPRGGECSQIGSLIMAHPYGVEEIAAAIDLKGLMADAAIFPVGVQVANMPEPGEYLRNLMYGHETAPPAQVTLAICDFFNVHPTFFLNRRAERQAHWLIEALVMDADRAIERGGSMNKTTRAFLYREYQAMRAMEKGPSTIQDLTVVQMVDVAETEHQTNDLLPASPSPIEYELHKLEAAFEGMSKLFVKATEKHRRASKAEAKLLSELVEIVGVCATAMAGERADDFVGAYVAYMKTHGEVMAAQTLRNDPDKIFELDPWWDVAAVMDDDGTVYKGKTLLSLFLKTSARAATSAERNVRKRQALAVAVCEQDIARQICQSAHVQDYLRSLAVVRHITGVLGGIFSEKPRFSSVQTPTPASGP